MNILYITQNGISDHIGRSQVAPYLFSLAQEGFKIYLLSAEKSGRSKLINMYKQLFFDAKINWTYISYRMKPPIVGQVFTQVRLQFVADQIVRNHAIDLVHCRSHPTALIGEHIHDRYGVPFIFDFRDFYANGGLEKTSGFRRLLYQRIKVRERLMIRKAAHIVCLTKRAQQILANWYLSDRLNSEKYFTIIPCCADFIHFNPASVTLHEREEARVQLNISSDSTVLVYLGGLSEDYLLESMLKLFNQLLLIDPTSIFLFLANQGYELVERACQIDGIPIDRIRFVKVERERIPVFISLATLSVVFIRSTIAKAGCSPIKLAELFAMNVPVIANSGVGDLDEIISLKSNGSRIVNDFQDVTLQKAIKDVLAWNEMKSVDIRASSSAFDLPLGVSMYAAIYHQLLEA